MPEILPYLVVLTVSSWVAIYVILRPFKALLQAQAKFLSHIAKAQGMPPGEVENILSDL